MKKLVIISFILVANCFYGFAQTNNLTDEELKEFNRRTKEIIDEFQGYLSFIGSKSNTTEDKKKYRAVALKLFIGNGKAYTDFYGNNHSPAMMEVSSKTTGRTRNITVENYLINLSNLPYSKVEITSSELCKVGDFYQLSDGQYVAVATIKQRFRGYRDGRVIYEDVVEKHITVYLTRSEVYSTKGIKYVWILKLGDTTVDETR